MVLLYLSEMLPQLALRCQRPPGTPVRRQLSYIVSYGLPTKPAVEFHGVRKPRLAAGQVCADHLACRKWYKSLMCTNQIFAVPTSETRQSTSTGMPVLFTSSRVVVGCFHGSGNLWLWQSGDQAALRNAGSTAGLLVAAMLRIGGRCRHRMMLSDAVWSPPITRAASAGVNQQRQLPCSLSNEGLALFFWLRCPRHALGCSPFCPMSRDIMAHWPPLLVKDPA